MSSNTQTQYQKQYHQEHRLLGANAPEGYVQGTRTLTPKAYLVALWCKEGLQAIRALPDEQRVKAVKTFRRAQAKARESGAFTPRALLACIKASLAAVTAVPIVSQDYAAEVEFVAQAATLADSDLGDTVRLLAGYFRTGGRTSRGEDLADSGKRGQAYIRACRAVNALGGAPRNSVRKTQVIRNLCKDSPFGESLGEVVLYLVQCKEAQELADSVAAKVLTGEVSQEVAAEEQAEAKRLALGIPKILHEFRVWSSFLYAACIEQAKATREEALAEQAAETPQTTMVHVSRDGGETWTDEEVTIKRPKQDRRRKRVAGIETVSLDVLQERAWRQEEALQAAEDAAVWD